MTIPIDDSLKDRVILITGGSRGFGWFIAQRLLEGGAKVILTASRSANQLKDVNEKAKGIAGADHCLTIQADVANWNDCQRTVDAVLNAFGKIDVLINNAGKGSSEYRVTMDSTSTRFWDIPVESWRSIIETNLTGTFQMTKAVIPTMIEQKQGKIFSISTSLTTMIGTGLSPYGASKAGLEAAHVVWARELKNDGIDVNILLPGGASDTDFIPQVMVAGEVGKRVGPTNRLLPGDVIVPPAVYLCTDATKGITGRRIIAKFWDHDLPAADAFTKCLQPQHEHPEIM